MENWVSEMGIHLQDMPWKMHSIIVENSVKDFYTILQYNPEKFKIFLAVDIRIIMDNLVGYTGIYLKGFYVNWYSHPDYIRI